jgi:hypothetical protein
VRRAAGVLGPSLVLVACASQSVVCTEIGCDSGVSVTVEGFRAGPADTIKVHACLGSVCRDRTVAEEPSVVFIDAPESGTVSTVVVSVEVKQGSDVLVRGRRELTLHKIAPNGERCGPVCYVGFLAISPAGLRQP